MENRFVPYSDGPSEQDRTVATSRRVPDKDTIYTLASCTKGFTGTAIGLLAYQGKINLDEKVTHYLPSFHTKNSPA
ncbi:hypothetical protein COL922a_014623, partial [Colletotrichum nupharicola]